MKKYSSVNLSIYYYLSSFYKAVEFVLLIAFCLILITTSKIEKKVNDHISSFFLSLSLPLSQIISYPINSVITLTDNLAELLIIKQENQALKAENRDLRTLYIKALSLKQENRELKSLLNFVGARSSQYKTASLIAYPNQLYSRNIIINAGSQAGIRENDLVAGENAVIGRVIETTANRSRVLLITDANSRLPVIVYSSGDKAILAGNNSDLMTLLYLEKNHKVKKGDIVFTATDGDYITPGLPLGIVKKVDKQHVIVEMIENIATTTLVTIISYGEAETAL